MLKLNIGYVAFDLFAELLADLYTSWVVLKFKDTVGKQWDTGSHREYEDFTPSAGAFNAPGPRKR